MGFPIWIIVVVVVVVVVLFSGIGGYILISRKRRQVPPTVDVEAHVTEKVIPAAAPILEEHPSTISDPPSYAAKDTQSSPPISTTEPCPEEKPLHQAKRKSSRKHESKISLPMPPASSSLFSDKMELSSEEAMELFDRYMNADLDKSNNNGGGFTANIQQKAATIRSTVRMSLRRKSTSKGGGSTPLNQLFDSSENKPPASPSVSSHHTGGSTPSLADHPLPPTPSTPSSSSRQQQQQSTSVPPSPAPQQDQDTTLPSAVEEAASAAYTGKTNTNNGNAAAAARRVIRTASRKSKTRSMLVNEDDVMKMFSNDNTTQEQQHEPLPTGAAGSVRRLAREMNEKSASVSAMRARNKGNTANARDIAEWFPTNQNGTATVAGRVPHHRPAPPVQNMFSQDQVTSNKPQHGNVDNVRQMLQATWQANMRESGSMASIVSTTEAAVAASNNSSMARYGRQNPLLRGNTSQHVPVEDVSPPPMASFSSSTVRTVVPEAEKQQPSLTSVAAQEKIEIDGTNFTMLSAQNGYKTWNGRSNPSRPPLIQQQPTQEKTTANQGTSNFFNTVSLGRRHSSKRRVMPWMDEKERTPAQRERDQYLSSQT
ncbi:hypothetical protein LRAMOSA09661 [Lichtheimia ramosa]|uniref:Uncharacterized protein n=1 Tax=Lichtheimia ramosa TaxID=688394 RepID=A0A077WJB6_9FUNG|nr:hypothetical protein LRAMOSA09661 [Lichtheimia ramosa]